MLLVSTKVVILIFQQKLLLNTRFQLMLLLCVCPWKEFQMYSRMRTGSVGSAVSFKERMQINLAAWIAVDKSTLPQSPTRAIFTQLTTDEHGIVPRNPYAERRHVLCNARLIRFECKHLTFCIRSDSIKPGVNASLQSTHRSGKSLSLGGVTTLVEIDLQL